MTEQTIGLLLVMIIYLILMVGIGVLYSKKNNDVSDFYLGGRELGPIVTAMSAEASDMSSWLLMDCPVLRIFPVVLRPAGLRSGLQSVPISTG